MGNKILEVIESLSPIEKKILPFLEEKSLKEIEKKAEIDKASLMRALEFLSNKGIIKLERRIKEIVDLGDNGALYLKNSLPERRLLNLLAEKQNIDFDEAKKNAKLGEDELKASIGALKKKAMLEVKKDKITLIAKLEEITKKSLEENFLESLPLELKSLTAEQKHALENLKNRKNIIHIKKEPLIKIEITKLGEKILKSDLKIEDMIESLTSDMIVKELWKGKKFRRYDIKSNVPEISGGKRHFINQAIDYARKIWLEMGFEEMSNGLLETSFWNFDALFTPQDHPAREMQDTFFLPIKGKLPDKKIVNRVKEAHEKGVSGSKGWQYSWKEDEASKIVMRTHTTCLSVKTLAKLSELKQNKEIKGKFFAIGRCFRNETLDWSHGFEFNQTEGIVIDENVSFKHLLGYLKEFFNKMGFEKIRFTPAYFPYTEPSVEISAFHEEKKIWLELGGAGIFRPEVVVPLLGRWIPVLAWGPGFDRIIMDYYQIKDLRELYENNLTKLRKIKAW